MTADQRTRYSLALKGLDVSTSGQIDVRQNRSPSAGFDVEALPGLRELWGRTHGVRDVCIAVLDGPVDLTHEAFAGVDIAQLDSPASSLPVTGPAVEHGTHVASVIFGQWRGPVRGIAPGCRGLVVPIYSDVAAGVPVPCSQLELARAILLAAQAGATIINISGGQLSSSGTAHPVLADAVERSHRQGVLIVAAAGNQGCDCLHIPGALPLVLPVGAMGASGEPLEFSNWGEAYRRQGILAPGQNIVGAHPGGGVRQLTGTSFAAPIVSGVAGLLLSLQKTLGRDFNVVEVRKVLLDSALGCDYREVEDCRRLLTGRLNVEGALELSKRGEGQMVPLAGAETIETGVSASINELVQETAVSMSCVSPKVTETALATGAVQASGCGCGGGSPPQIVYALGQLSYDFGTEARRDSIAQSMEAVNGSLGDPNDPRQLLTYLESHPWESASLNWTLNSDGMTIYAIRPLGPFAADTYQFLRRMLKEQLTEGVERISVPGYSAGKVKLLNGQSVPAILPEMRGMYSWTTKALVDSVVGAAPMESASETDKEAHSRKMEGLRNFLDRIYFELRNLGVTSQERAMNYAGTNAFNIEKVYESAMKEEMELDAIDVERSSLCRPDSDCWDVKLYFFFPGRQVQTVRKVYRFTVDVSDVVPVTVGATRCWFVR